MKFLLIFLLSITASAQYTNTNVKATQAGPWSISNSSFGISGSLPAGTNALGSITNTSFGSTQSGVWNVGLSTGSNVIGSISNTGFGITGTLPAFAATPTFNIGTGAFVDRTTAVAPYAQRLSDGTSFYDARSIRSLTSADVVTVANPTSTTGLALEAGHLASMDATLALIKTKTDNIDVALSSRTKPSDTQNISGSVSVSSLPSIPTGGNVIGSISNSSFGISGSLPSGTNALGSITNTVFGSTQSGIWNTGRTWALASSTDSTSAVITSMPAITGSVSITGTPNVNVTNASLAVTAASLPLPSGASTSALQTSGNSSLTSIDGKLTTTANGLKVDNSAVTQPISASSLPLPSGAATSSLQTTGNTSVSNIDSKTPALGQALAAASSPVVLPAAQITALTPPTTVTVTQATGTNLHTVVDSGTVTANIGTAGTLATDTSVNSLLKPASTLAAVTAITNTVTVKADTPANQTNAMKVDGTATTQPVSIAGTVATTGTVTANIGTTNGLALEAGHAASTDISTAAINSKLTDTQYGVTLAVVAVDAATSTSGQLITGTPTGGSSANFVIANWNTATVLITGTWTGSLSPEISIDGTNFIPTTISVPNQSTPLTAVTQNTSGYVNLSGATRFRLRATAFSSGTAQATINQSRNIANNYIANTSLPLPTGAATATNQATEISSLSSIVTNTAATVTALNAAIPAGTNSIGQVTTNAGTNTSTASLNLETTQAAMNAKIPALGQTTMAASQPVTIASNQTAIPTSRSWTTAASTDSTQAWLRDGLGNPIASLTDGNGNNALEVAMASTSFVFSTLNSSTVQLAAAATFTGTIETAQNQQSISLLLTSDQNGTLTINQYITNAATFKVVPIVFTITANTQFSRSFPINGNFVNVTFQNTGGATTTTFNLNTAYGTIPASTARGNMPMSLEEVSGLPFVTSLKGVQATNALPVQNLLDSGRVLKSYSATFTAATTEALVSMTPIADGVAGGAATSFAVTATKRLRLSQMCVTTRNAGVATQGVVVQLRMINTGAVTATSPLVGTASAGTSMAVANVASGGCISFPDGMEMSGTMQFGVSQIGTATANNTVVVHGFEY